MQARAQAVLEQTAAVLSSEGIAICSLSLTSAAEQPAGSRLLVTRYTAGRPPLLVSLPTQGLLAAASENASQVMCH
jgi:hypothetical protein